MIFWHAGNGYCHIHKRTAIKDGYWTGSLTGRDQMVWSWPGSPFQTLGYTRTKLNRTTFRFKPKASPVVPSKAAGWLKTVLGYLFEDKSYLMYVRRLTWFAQPVHEMLFVGPMAIGFTDVQTAVYPWTRSDLFVYYTVQVSPTQQKQCLIDLAWLRDQRVLWCSHLLHHNFTRTGLLRNAILQKSDVKCFSPFFLQTTKKLNNN